MAALVVGLLLAACLSWRTPSPERLAWTAALAALSLFCWFTAYAQAAGLWRSTTVLATALALALGVLVWCGAAVDKAVMLCLSLGLALVVGEAALESRRAGQPVDAADSDLIRQFRQGQALRHEMPIPDRAFPFPKDVWVRGRSHVDPDLMYILEPHGLLKQYYPDNPRGYFYEESGPEWAMRQHWDTPGDRSYFLTPLSADGRSVRVHFRTPYRPREYNPQVAWGRFAVRMGQRLGATLRCRSDKPRRVFAVWVGAVDPWPKLAAEGSFEVAAEWREQALNSVATADHDQAHLVLAFSPDEAPLDLADVQITVGDQPATLKPLPDLYRHYVSYSMNSQGHRDHEYVIPRPEQVFRIVCLGDSFTFGQGVHSHHVVSAVLAARLNEQADALGDDTRFEAINCGTCGYATREERFAYERICRPYGAQLVLVLMVLNDDINSRDEQSQLAKQGQGFEVLEAVRQAAKSSQRDFTKSLAELKALNQSCQADGAKLVVAVYRHEPLSEASDWNNLIKTVQPGLAELDIPFIDLGESILAKGNYNDLRVYPGGDAHPSPLAHAAAAEALETFLRGRGLVPLAP